VAIHFATHFATKKIVERFVHVENSLGIRWLGPQRNFNKIPTICFVAKCCGKTNQHFVKMLVFFDFWGVAKCFVTTFLHQKKQWNFVKISLGKRPNPRNPNEILTKQNRQNPVIQGLIANGQISG
jgi:hypothetical protein